MTPHLRALQARAAAYESWARTSDPTARTAPARAAADARFERQVDPDGTLPPAERARRAEQARKAYFARLAVASVKARQRTTGTSPADRYIKAAAVAKGWKVTNAGEARTALALSKIGFGPAIVETQFQVGRYRLDFAFPAHHIDIEADGWVHTAASQRAHDRTRDRALKSWGWEVARIDVSGDIEVQLRHWLRLLLPAEGAS